MRRLMVAFLAAFALVACSAPGTGVSRELAVSRKSNISDLHYRLSFIIPEAKDSSIVAQEAISLFLNRKQELILDFKEDPASILDIRIGGRKVVARIKDEHIIIPSRYLNRGRNSVDISFIAGEQSLNRRDELMYTLLVPDRARTLFPCFDQPDLKAVYELTLTVPQGWSAVSNTAVVRETKAPDSRRCYEFAATEPLSTYLFSFVAGKFQKVSSECDGRSISMYYRETDPARLAQIPDIFALVFDSIDWIEDYTAMPYPFAKYDFIVLPDFQYGGMEHTGATLYNDRRIFLGPAPSKVEVLDRASLIAHETAHMWFGDCVTMRWFDDVWTKEVFANWFAYKIMRPAFPEINHKLSDLASLYAPAYAEDRTEGSNAIQRPLDNLNNAGLIYCSIIYDKAPVMMDKLARRMGADSFREAIREYLSTYKYSNASWDDLVEILAKHADFDVSEWSRVWVKEKGMPIYRFQNGVLVQSDPFGAGNIWQQEVEYLEPEKDIIVPNPDGEGYGYFALRECDADYIMKHFSEFDETCRMSELMNLYENTWRGELGAAIFVDWCSNAILVETNPIILNSMLGYASDIALHHGSGTLPAALLTLASDRSRPLEHRTLAFRKLQDLAEDTQTLELLYDIWNSQKPLPGLVMDERNYTSLALQLMIRFPERAEAIRNEQRKRISNPDRLENFDYVSRAASADKLERSELFQEMLSGTRRPESRVLSALALLVKQDGAELVRPALEVLQDVQRTGDIFMPASWCKTLLRNQVSEEASMAADAFLAEHPDYPELLKTKILQAK